MKRVIAFMVALLLLASLMTYNLSLEREEDDDWHTIRIETVECPEDDYCTWLPVGDWNCSEWRNATYDSNGDTINIETQICWCIYEVEP